MRIAFAVALLQFALAGIAQSQWLEMQPIVLVEDLEERVILDRSRLQINDNGDALYMTARIRGANPIRDPQINRLHLGNSLVYEGGKGTTVGDLNDSGEFAFAEDNALFVGDKNGVVEEIIPCCDFTMTYQGVGGDERSPPRIDGAGNPYFLGSSLEQLPQGTEGYSGGGSIYNAEQEVVLGDIGLVEVLLDAPWAFQSWDVNENGDVLVGNMVIPNGESQTGFDFGFDDHNHVSLNNHGQFTGLGTTKGENGEPIPAIAVLGGEEEFVFAVEDQPFYAFVNDSGSVAYQVGENLVDVTGISLRSPAGEITPLLRKEDVDEATGRFILHDFNDAGQLGIATKLGFFLATPSTEPLSDLNFDGLTNSDDINRLANAVRSGTTRPLFDLNMDGKVDTMDIDHWVQQLVGTVPGDANLDRNVDFTDFLMLSAGFGTDSGWSGGDFDSSGETDFNDFLTLSDNFGTELSQQSVPEPTSKLLAALALLMLTSIRRRS